MNKLQKSKFYSALEPIDCGQKTALQSRNIDLIIVPGLAFTKSGERLGKGRGYYDRYLAKLRNKFGTSVKFVGICFREQVVESTLSQKHDVAMDLVIFD